MTALDCCAVALVLRSISPQLIRQLALGTVVMKAFDLVGAIAASRLNDASHLPVVVNQECVRILNALAGLRAHIFTDPTSCLGRSPAAVKRVSVTQQQIMIAMVQRR